MTTWRSNIPRIVVRSHKNLAEVVKSAAFGIEARAKILAPVDTGFLRKSIEAEKVAELMYRVAVGAEYGIFVEFGTTRAPAQPFLSPAIDQVVQQFGGELKKVI